MPSWNGTDYEPQYVSTEDNPAYGSNLGPFYAFPCGHEIQNQSVRPFLAEPINPVGAQFSRYRRKPILCEDDLDTELCLVCLKSQLEAGRAVIVSEAGVDV